MIRKLFFIVLAFMMGTSMVCADVINFTDGAIHWPSWTNGIDDTTDHIGHIDFIDGQIVTTDSGVLERITFNYLNNNASLMPMDLFLDTDADNVWDYVVKLYMGQNTNHIYILPDNYSLYQISVPEDSRSAYVEAWLTPDPSYYREGHPVALESYPSSPIGTVYFDGWKADPNGSSILSSTFYFYNNNNITSPVEITLSDNFIIAWTVQCANDVLYYEHREVTPTYPYGGSSTIPEPSSVVLVGIGLLGVVFWSRSKNRK